MRRQFPGILTVFCVVLSLLQTQSILSLVTASSSASPRGGAATRTRLTTTTDGDITEATTAQPQPSIFDAGEMVVDDPSMVRIQDERERERERERETL